MNFTEIQNGVSAVNLADREFAENDFERLAELLKNNTTLTSLDLSCTGMTLDQFRPLARVLKLHNRTLRKFRLPNNAIGCAGAKLLADALSVNNVLNYFTVEDNQIGFDGAAAIAQCLKTSTTLQVVGVRVNQLFAAGANFFADALMLNRSLTWLDISDCRIAANGTKDICEALKTNQVLRRLDLTHSNLRDEGGLAIAAMLSLNSSLLDLYLSRNDLTIQSIKPICLSLQNDNRRLTCIYFGGNFMSDEHRPTFEALFKTNYALLTLDLSGSWVGVETVNATRAMTQRNADLRWSKCHATLLDIAIAMFSLQLPVYVLLFIVDTLPHWHVAIPMYKKVRLIEGVYRSMRNIIEHRHIAK